MRWPAGAGHVEEEHPEVLQSPTASQDAESEHSIRARFAALSGRIRRQPPLSPEDSDALLAAFQAPDVTCVQVIPGFTFLLKLRTKLLMLIIGCGLSVKPWLKCYTPTLADTALLNIGCYQSSCKFHGRAGYPGVRRTGRVQLQAGRPLPGGGAVADAEDPCGECAVHTAVPRMPSSTLAA